LLCFYCATTSKTDTEPLRKETAEMFEKKLGPVLTITWISIAMAAVLEIAGFLGLVIGIIRDYETNLVIFFGVVVLSAGQFHLLAKLWYWIYHNELRIREDLKRLQLQIAELTGKNPPDKS
jgi:uncharacterized membrane protein